MKEISIRILKIMLLVVIGVCLFSVVSNVNAMHIEGNTTLVKGDTITLAVYDEEGNKVACHWTSKDSEKASVINGRVTAKKVGSATIVAKSFESGEECSITVTVIDSNEDSSVTNDVNSSDSSSGEAIGSLVEITITVVKAILAKLLPLIIKLISSAI